MPAHFVIVAFHSNMHTEEMDRNIKVELSLYLIKHNSMTTCGGAEV
jgi:hypothetical protein